LGKTSLRKKGELDINSKIFQVAFTLVGGKRRYRKKRRIIKIQDSSMQGGSVVSPGKRFRAHKSALGGREIYFGEENPCLKKGQLGHKMKSEKSQSVGGTVFQNRVNVPPP